MNPLDSSMQSDAAQRGRSQPERDRERIAARMLTRPRGSSRSHPIMHNFQEGDWVVYRKRKDSAHPGPRAKNVHPSHKGDLYSYTVDKYWIVDRIQEDGTLRLRTRTGKTNILAADHPLLRPARMWERWLLGNRFPTEDVLSDSAQDPDAASASDQAPLPA